MKLPHYKTILAALSAFFVVLLLGSADAGSRSVSEEKPNDNK